MRIKKGFVLREIVGQKVVTGEGLEQVDFNKLVTLNSSAAYLWEQVVDREFDWKHWSICCWMNMTSNVVSL